MHPASRDSSVAVRGAYRVGRNGAALYQLNNCSLHNQVHAAIAQLVERIHGKDEVSGSSPDRGSIVSRLLQGRRFIFACVYVVDNFVKLAGER